MTALSAISRSMSLYCAMLCLVLPALVATSSSRGSPAVVWSSASSRSRSNDSPRSPRVYNQWGRLFRVARSSSTGKLDFPEVFGHEECLGLLDHLKSRPKDIKPYNELLCMSIDGAVFKTMVSVISASTNPDFARSKLFGKKCIANMPIETWSIMSPFHASTLDLTISSLPKAALPYLSWQTFRSTAFAHMAAQIHTPQAYNGWCKYLPKKFSRAIWTDNLWHILSPECVADIANPDAQIAAVKLIAEKSEWDMKKPEIGRPDLFELGLRLIRIQAIKRVLTHNATKTAKHVLEYIIKKKNNLIERLTELHQINTDYLKTANRTATLNIRCGIMKSMLSYCDAHGGDKVSSAATKGFLEEYGNLDPLSIFTWEAVSKLAVKNPSAEAIHLIADLVTAGLNDRLPLDTLLEEALRNGSSIVIKTIIDATQCNRLLNYIRSSLQKGRRQLGEHTVIALVQRIHDTKQASVTFSGSTS